MSFYVILRDRDDGDYDTVAAVQYDDDSLDIPSAEWALQMYEHCQDLHEGEVFRIVRLANVDDVVSQELWDGEDTPDIAPSLKAMLNTAIFPSDANVGGS